LKFNIHSFSSSITSQTLPEHLHPTIAFRTFREKPPSQMADLLDSFDDASELTDFDGTRHLPVSRRDSTNLEGMLAGSDEDDLFGNPDPAPIIAADSEDGPPAQPSALIAWKQQKDQELAAKDQADGQAAEKLRQEAEKKLVDYKKTLQTEQEKRARLNAQADEVKLSGLEKEGNRWEKVGLMIDFTRNENHVKDVSRFKTLLIQLKQLKQ
jgi:hypothetical protein